MSVPIRSAPPPVTAAETLAVTTELVQTSGLRARVVVPRQPGMVRLARAIADRAAVDVSVDVAVSTISAHYTRRPPHRGQPSAGA